MATGTLRKETLLNNHVMQVKIRKGTVAYMLHLNGSPTIIFDGYPFRCIRENSEWYIILHGQRSILQFPEGGIPFPFSYFKK